MSALCSRSHGVTKRFGGLSALDDLSFEVDEGEIVSVIGPNGAGQVARVFNVITGLYPPDAGDVRVPRRQSSSVSRPTGSPSWASRARSRTCTCSRT